MSSPPFLDSSDRGRPLRALLARAARLARNSFGAFRRRPATKPEEVVVGSSDASPARAGVRPIEVLLAEDNDLNALVLVRMLESLGCRTTRVTTGADALAAIREQRFDVVFVDWQMPEMDGLEAVRRIRRMEERRATPIVVVTANARPEDRETCLRAGADEYLAKPVRDAELRAALALLVRPPRGEAARRG